MKELIINNVKLTIKNPSSSSSSKLLIPSHSYIALNVNGSTIYIASRQYAKSPKTMAFYNALNIDENIDLRQLEHGTAYDTPAKTIPLFLKAANCINTHLKNNKTVLVNCNHGRSRSGSVVALFLMEHMKFSAKQAIDVVTDVLKERGYDGGVDLKGGPHGTYGDWLRCYEAGAYKENAPEPQAENPNRLYGLRKRKIGQISNRFENQSGTYSILH